MKIKDIATDNLEGIDKAGVVNLHRRVHQLYGRAPEDSEGEEGITSRLLEEKHAVLVEELVRRGFRHETDLKVEVKAEAEKARPEPEPEGTYLAPPHGEFIWRGKKRAIAKDRKWWVGGEERVIVSGKLAYGVATIGRPEEVNVAEFDRMQRVRQHCVYPEERERWWRKAEVLTVYPIERFERFDPPRPVNVSPGVQGEMKTVDYKEIDWAEALLLKLRNLPRRFVWIPDFVSLAGSQIHTTKDREPEDIGVIVRAEEEGDGFALKMSPDAAFAPKLERVLKEMLGDKRVQYSAPGHGPGKFAPLYDLCLVRKKNIDYVELDEPEFAEMEYKTTMLSDLEIVDKAVHGRSNCMDCKQAPVVDVQWADGRGRAWFCLSCFKQWVADEDREIVRAWFIDGGEVPKKLGDEGEQVQKLRDDLKPEEIIERLEKLQAADKEATIVHFDRSTGKAYFEEATSDGKVQVQQDDAAVAASTKTFDQKAVEGVWLLLFLRPADAKRLAKAAGNIVGEAKLEPASKLHVTVAGLEPDAEKRALVEAVAAEMANKLGSVHGDVGGVGRFGTTGQEGPFPIYASFDSPELNEWRDRLLIALDAIGVEPMEEHGYQPHITLAYVDKIHDGFLVEIGEQDLTLDRLSLIWDGERKDFPLKGRKQTSVDFMPAQEAPAEQEVEIMPYERIRELPDSVKNVLPTGAQKIWMEVFNASEERYDDETRAFKIAWGAVKRTYRPPKEGEGKQWVKKEEGEKAYQPDTAVDSHDWEFEGASKVLLEETCLEDEDTIRAETTDGRRFRSQDDGVTWKEEGRKPRSEEEEEKLFDGRDVLLGPDGDHCECPECKEVVEHLTPRPCAEITCPKCDEAMRPLTGISQKATTEASEGHFHALDSLTLEGNGTTEPSQGHSHSVREFQVAPAEGHTHTISQATRDLFAVEAAEKAGRRVSKSKLEELKALQADFQEWVAKVNEKLGQYIGWGEYADKLEPSGFDDWATFFGPGTSGAKVVRVDGHPWLLTWTTNAFQDREGEIFSTKSIQEYVEWADKMDAEGAQPFKDIQTIRIRNGRKELSNVQGARGELWFYHTPLRMGETKWQAEHGRFLIEGHKIDDEPFILNAVQKMEKELDKWAVSHGFKYREKDREDGVFEWFRKFEASPVPVDKASNPWTGLEVAMVGGKIKMAMNDSQREEGTRLFGPDFPEIVERLERTSKELEATVAYKDVEEGAAEGSEAEGEKAVDPVQQLKLVLARVKEDEQAAGILKTVIAAMEKNPKPDEKEKEEKKGEEEKPPEPKAEKEFLELDEKSLTDLNVALGGEQRDQAIAVLMQSVKALTESHVAIQNILADLQRTDEEKVEQKIRETSRIINLQFPPKVEGQKEAAEAAAAPAQVGKHPFADMPYGPGMMNQGGAP